MKKVFLMLEDAKMRKVLADTHDMMLAAAKHGIPTAQRISDHAEIAKLHDILALMRNGDVSLTSYDIAGIRCFTLEINDDREFRIPLARL